MVWIKYSPIYDKIYFNRYYKYLTFAVSLAEAFIVFDISAILRFNVSISLDFSN
jgi:hypothetical protein